jgi:hypothetical protein
MSKISIATPLVGQRPAFSFRSKPGTAIDTQACSVMPRRGNQPEQLRNLAEQKPWLAEYLSH